MNKLIYVAFLRGINVGGNRTIPMADLKKCFESLGFQNVKTVLNSGNVIFEAEESVILKLKKNIENELKNTFQKEVSVILCTKHDINELVQREPFKYVTVTPETRLYVTFLSNDPAETPKSILKIPYESPEKDFRILSVTDKEIVSVLTLSPQKNTTDIMKILEKEFGKNITTRNWNTVMRIDKLL
jgi:uncharacterized protein (DUF1697 family)